VSQTHRAGAHLLFSSDVRQLSVQVHPLDMTSVCRRALPSIQPLLLSAKQGGIGFHFYSLWYDSAGDRTHDLPISGQALYNKATEPVDQHVQSGNFYEANIT